MDRNFALFAACGSDDVIDMHGESSFTSAVIWALEYIARTKPSFTTHQLLEKINDEPPNFPRHQHALITERVEETRPLSVSLFFLLFQNPNPYLPTLPTYLSPIPL